MLKLFINIILLLIAANGGYAQTYTLGDSLQIEFKRNAGEKRMVDSESDLKYDITIKNISNRVVYAYSWLVYRDTADLFCNYYFFLDQKQADTYQRIENRFLCGVSFIYYDSLYELYHDFRKVDSAIGSYDIRKNPLQRGETRTLSFNLLAESTALNAGDYKFQVHLRTGTTFKKAEGGKEMPSLNYIDSDWYYFTMRKRLVTTLAMINNPDNDHP